MIAIPDWVPPSVTKEACALLKNGNPLGHDWRPVIIRLVTNVEMKKVWDELKNENGKTEKEQRRSIIRQYCLTTLSCRMTRRSVKARHWR